MISPFILRGGNSGRENRSILPAVRQLVRGSFYPVPNKKALGEGLVWEGELHPFCHGKMTVTHPHTFGGTL